MESKPFKYQSASQVAAEEKSHNDDPDGNAVGEPLHCCGMKVQQSADGKKVCLSFTEAWLASHMQTSCKGLVPFRHYGTGSASPEGEKTDAKSEKEVQRGYPRAFATSIYIDGNIKKASADGGRRHLGSAQIKHAAAPYALKKDPGDGSVHNACIDSRYCLSDILIVHKRRCTEYVITHCKRLNVMTCESRMTLETSKAGAKKKPQAKGKGSEQDELTYGEPMPLAYPLLVILFKPLIKDIRLTKGHACMAVVVFTAMLNDRLLERKCSIEVVAREGFGSVIPSTSDLGDGIRLDPGVLPDEHWEAVIETITLLDKFMENVALWDKPLANSVANMQDFGQQSLGQADRLIEMLTRESAGLHGLDLDKKVIKIIAILEGKTSANAFLPVRTNSSAYQFCENLPGKAARKPVEAKKYLPGYGSDSETELDTDEHDTATASVSNQVTKDPFVISKLAFISGMAAIQICEKLAEKYIGKPVDDFNQHANTSSSSTTNRKKLGADSPQPTSLASYFEADKVHVVQDALMLNAAPNPKNALTSNYNPAAKPDDLPNLLGGIGARIVTMIDVTNITTFEKAQYIRRFIKNCLLNNFDHHLLVLQESGSKHPIGGDLVFGVLRVIGHRSAVEKFFELANTHLKADMEGSDKTTTALDPSEHALRQLLQERHFISRNRDLVSYVNNGWPNKMLERF